MNFRELDIAERDKVVAFYELTSYRRPISNSDRVFVADNADRILGVARIEGASGVQVLRGMYIHPDFTRQGIGTRLLKATVPTLSETNSFCIPRDHLCDFYSGAGFRVIDPDDAPDFLSERLATYLKEGLSVAIMQRTPGAGQSMSIDPAV
ncbi:MAG: GNAT family N-acetyltransferase [Pseudomonadota bacterium]